MPFYFFGELWNDLRITTLYADSSDKPQRTILWLRTTPRLYLPSYGLPVADMTSNDEPQTFLPQTSFAQPTSNPLSASVKAVRTVEELHLSLTLRTSVFVEEHLFPPSHEYDSNDIWPIPDHVTHFIVLCYGVPVATCRIRQIGMNIRLEHVAVHKNLRRRGIGRALLRYVENFPIVSKSRGVMYCSVIKQRELFYRNLGWVVEHGHGVLQVFGIPYILMVRRRRPLGAPNPNLSLSHVMIRAINLCVARRFYSLLSFQDTSRFISDDVRVAWIEVRASL